MHRSVWLAHVVVCTTVLVTWLPQATAQTTTTDSEPDSSEYQAFVSQALQAYEAGRFAEARTSFRRAHEIQPTARTLRTIGMCSFNLGDYIDALRNLDAALSDGRKPLSAEQRDHAVDLIAQSQGHVGRFKVRLSPPNATLWVDGRPPARLVSGEVLLEPGRRELLVQADGHQPNRSTLRVDGGDRATLEFRLEPDSEPAVAAAPGTPVSETPAAADVTDHASTGTTSAQPVLGYVALGIAGASLIGFGITTGLAAEKSSDLDERCDGRRCAPAYHDDVDSYDRYKLLSTITLIGAATFAVAGTLLLVFDPGETTEHASLRPVLGVGSIGVRGRL